MILTFSLKLYIWVFLVARLWALWVLLKGYQRWWHFLSLHQSTVCCKPLRHCLWLMSATLRWKYCLCCCICHNVKTVKEQVWKWGRGDTWWYLSKDLLFFILFFILTVLHKRGRDPEWLRNVCLLVRYCLHFTLEVRLRDFIPLRGS